MTGNPGDAVIRRPWHERAWNVIPSGILGVLFGLNGAFTVGDQPRRASADMIIMALIGAWCYRDYRLSVELGADALTVRNSFRTRRIQRDEISGFGIAPVRLQPFMRAVQVVLRDGRKVSLDVTVRISLLRRDRDSLQRDIDTLRTWEPRAVAA